MEPTYEQHKAIQLAKRHAKDKFINSIPKNVVESLESFTFAQFAEWHTPSQRKVANFAREVIYQYCMDVDVCAEDVTWKEILDDSCLDEAFNDTFQD